MAFRTMPTMEPTARPERLIAPSWREPAGGVAYADGQDQNEGCDQNITGLGEVNLVLDDVADADRRDHTVEHRG